MIDKFEKAKYDKLQTILGENGISPNTFKYARIALEDKTEGKHVMCPFCLNPFYLSQFKKEKQFYECSFCHNKMTGETLSKMFDIFNCEKIQSEKYADWVFGYRINGFFQKIVFKDWILRLQDLHISYDFWEKYRKLKGEYLDLQKKTEKEERDEE